MDEAMKRQKYSEKYWLEGTAIIERALKKAVRSEHGDAPFPLNETQAALWHQAQASAYQHALEMMGVPEDARPRDNS